MTDMRIFSEIDFIKTLCKVYDSGFEPMDIRDIVSKFSFNFPYKSPHGLGSCSGIAYCGDRLKIVQKRELIEFVSINYRVCSNKNAREELKIADKSLLDHVASFGCFRIVPRVFEVLWGIEYSKEYVEEHGFEEGKTKILTPEQISDNLLLLDIVNGDMAILEKIVSSVGEGIGLTIRIGERTNHHTEGSCSIKTWLLYSSDNKKGINPAIDDMGLLTYDINTPLLGQREH